MLDIPVSSEKMLREVVIGERRFGRATTAGAYALLLLAVGCGGGSPGSGMGGSGGGSDSGLRWTWLHAPIGGPVGAVAVDDSGNVFAGLGISGGIFRSTDDGTSWQPINAGMYDLSVSVLAASGTTVYAGANNLVRSGDDGRSWLQVTPLMSPGNVSAVGARGVLVAAGNDYDGSLNISGDAGTTFTSRSLGTGSTVDLEIVGSAILCATTNGVYRSTDGGATFGPVQGISNGALEDANLHCDGVSTCYASAHTGTALDPTVLLKSADGGASWTPLGMTNARVVAVTTAGTVYVNNGTSGLLVRSDDAGQNWQPATWPSPSCALPFAARGDKVFAACGDAVFRSGDKGETWSATTGSATAGAISGSASDVVVDVSSTALGAYGDIYAVAQAGFLRSIDDGATWQVMVPYAEPFLIPYACLVTGQGALECLEAQGPLVRSTDHGLTWQRIAVNPTDTPGSLQIQVTVVANSGSLVYAAGSQGVARSDDDGVTFRLLAESPAVTTLQVLHDGRVLVQSTSGTFRSDDRGATWKALGFFKVPVLEDTSGRLIYIDVGGATRYSTDAGDTWTYYPTTTLPGAAGLPTTDGSGRLILVLAGESDPFTKLGLPFVTYTSVDAGATWKILTPQIPNPIVNNFAVDKQGRLLAGTAGGLYRLESANSGP